MKLSYLALISTVLLTPLVSLVGCTGAQLTIDVDVYKGPLVEAPRGQLGGAIGQAAAMNNLSCAAEARDGLFGLPAHVRAEFAQLNSVFCALFGESSSGWADPVENFVPGTTNDRLSKPQLIFCAKLLAYAEASTLTASQLGLKEVLSLWFGNAETRRYATAIDEGARVLRDRVNATLFAYGARRTPVSNDEIEQALLSVPRDLRDAVRVQLKRVPSDGTGFSIGKLSAMMSSQDPGNVVAAQRNALNAAWIDTLYDNRYWSNINQVHVQGSGDTKYLVYKDEIGNWHLKSAEVDPSKIIYAIQSAATAAINIAAAAGGVPVNLPMPEAPTDAGFYGQSTAEALPIPQSVLDRIDEERQAAAESDAVIDRLIAQLQQIADRARAENWNADQLRSAVELAIRAAQNDL